jgi:predicted RNA binding protein YcfA (HicA-like mRNA interferase family)
MARVLRVREVVAILAADGWTVVQIRGSHRQFRHHTKPGVVTVAGAEGVEMLRGTLRSVFRQAGLPWRYRGKR